MSRGLLVFIAGLWIIATVLAIVAVANGALDRTTTTVECSSGQLVHHGDVYTCLSTPPTTTRPIT